MSQVSFLKSDYVFVKYTVFAGKLHCFASLRRFVNPDDLERVQLFNDFVDTDYENQSEWLLTAFDDFDGGYSKTYRLGQWDLSYTAEAYRLVEQLFKEVSK